jgi:16S rRNA G966 N2-methylase RsmD
MDGSSSRGQTRYHRAFLLSDTMRNKVLELSEVKRYGRESFEDPDYVSIYGLRPADWYARGVRLLARTAVECTRDRLSDLIGRDIADVARTAPDVEGSIVFDPFAGSANTLFWIGRHTEARSAIGFELDDGVFEATLRNLSLVDLRIELRHESFETGVKTLYIPADQLLIVFVAPPWGAALDETAGLDLRRTNPPVGQIVDLIVTTLRPNKLLVATQIFEATDSGSLGQVAARFDWSAVRMYSINASGQNHGLLLGTRGWTP